MWHQERDCSINLFGWPTPSPPCQQPGGVNAGGGTLGKTSSEELDTKEWWGKNVSTSQAAVIVLKLLWVTACGSWLPLVKAVSWVTLHNATVACECHGQGVAARGTAQSVSSSLPVRAWLDWLNLEEMGQSPFPCGWPWAGWVQADTPPSLQDRPHLQPCPSSACGNCFFAPWWLREYCD